MPCSYDVTVQLEDIWEVCMASLTVRAWLFNNHSLAPTEAFTCITNHLEPMSFVFAKHMPVDPQLMCSRMFPR